VSLLSILRQPTLTRGQRDLAAKTAVRDAAFPSVDPVPIFRPKSAYDNATVSQEE
jgi:hypothetical protein